jgi:hypothetical protein
VVEQVVEVQMAQVEQVVVQILEVMEQIILGAVVVAP